MHTWAGLFRRLERLDPAERRARAERVEFERWAAAAEIHVVSDLARAAKEKSREARSRTGVCVAVSFTANAASLTSFGGARAMLSLAVSGSSVDLYATRSEGRSPSIHLACQRAPTTSRYPVIVTLPGYLTVRSDGTGYRLLALPTRTPASIDEVLLRTFAILFGALESVSATRELSGSLRQLGAH
jgi:hypothetical protein